MNSVEHYKKGEDLLATAGGQTRPDHTMALANGHFAAAAVALKAEQQVDGAPVVAWREALDRPAKPGRF
jgi:hypothetical protein